MAATNFWAVVPKTDVAKIEAKQDGLAQEEDDPETLEAPAAGA